MKKQWFESESHGLIKPLAIAEALAFLTFCAAFTALAPSSGAATLYVSLSSTNPVQPYADWSTAATNIQDAVDAANSGDTVSVTNGVYQVGGRMLNSQPPTNRVALTKMIRLLSVNGPALTAIEGYQMPGVTNGASAVRCVYLTNGAVLAGFTLIHGATYLYLPGGGWNFGGAVYCQAPNPVVSLVSDAIISNCVIVGNSAAGGHVAYGGRLINCLLAFNSGGASHCSLNHCTVAANGNAIGGGVHFSAATNCIIYYNTASTGPNSWSSTLNHCCIPDSGGSGNFTNAPMFVDSANEDFHLLSTSACINAGANASVVSSVDLDGNPRIQGGTVDVGAYEYQYPESVLSYAWAQQYGFPTDGSADSADPDADGMGNYQEWIAGTDPTNAQSVFRMLAPSNSALGLVLSWTAVSNRTYFLERTTNLLSPLAFSVTASNLVGQSQFTVTNGPGAGAALYRAGVQRE